MNDDLLYQIALTMVPKVGAVISKNLLAYCGSAKAVFSKKKDQLLKIPGIGPKLAENIYNFKDLDRAEKELVFMEKNGVRPILFLDKDYPQRLKEIQDAPFLIYYKGKGNLNESRMVAVVGTRKATEYGKSACSRLIEELKEYNVTIVSGLAYGIDQAAHRASVKLGLPTIGVMANGLDIIYPSAHRSLAATMQEQGGILSEYPSGVQPDKERFPERNRIVAGMTDATIMIETARKGGSLITAEIANSYNREVFAMPGRAGDEYSAGCNHYIKINKAYLAETAADIAYVLGWDSEHKPTLFKKMPSNLSEVEASIYTYLKEKEKSDIDTLAYHLGFATSEVSVILLDMEFNGLIEALPGKSYRLV